MKKLIPLFMIFLALMTGCKIKTDCNTIFNDLKSQFSSGNFNDVRTLADSLKKYCPDNKKLISTSDSILDISERIRLDFRLTEDEFISRVSKTYGTVTDSMMKHWENKNWLEWKMIDGIKMYFNRSASNLVLLKKFYEDREKQEAESATDPEMVSRLRNTAEIISKSGGNSDPVVPVELLITYKITVGPDVVPEGEMIRCWIPLPKENHPRQKNLEILSLSQKDYIISPDSAIHRSVYMEAPSVKGAATEFSVRYKYISSGQYFNPDALKPLPYDKSTSLYRKYTSEQLPQICFTDNIRKLADEITGDEKDPVRIVGKIYGWFKANVPWTGAQEYSIIPNIPEYVYKNRRGDCGMQTLLFISMARYKGIPVRWQSGWKVPPDGKNLHDWCEVYYEGTGWVPVDVSYDLQYSKNEPLKWFFKSGIDSYRLIVNDGISGKLYPEKKYLRSEPYDFQRGEVEWRRGNLYFDKWDYNMKIEYQK